MLYMKVSKGGYHYWNIESIMYELVIDVDYLSKYWMMNTKCHKLFKMRLFDKNPPAQVTCV